MDVRPLVVGGGPDELLTVDIPADLTGDVDVELTCRPPLWKLSLLAFAFGLLLALATQAAWLITGRDRSATESRLLWAIPARIAAIAHNEQGDAQTLNRPGTSDCDIRGA